MKTKLASFTLMKIINKSLLISSIIEIVDCGTISYDSMIWTRISVQSLIFILETIWCFTIIVFIQHKGYHGQRQ